MRRPTLINNSWAPRLFRLKVKFNCSFNGFHIDLDLFYLKWAFWKLFLLKWLSSLHTNSEPGLQTLTLWKCLKAIETIQLRLSICLNEEQWVRFESWPQNPTRLPGLLICYRNQVKRKQEKNSLKLMKLMTFAHRNSSKLLHRQPEKSLIFSNCWSLSLC